MTARLQILSCLCGVASLLAAMPAWAAPTPSGLPVPRYVTLKFDKAIGRAGPSEDHRELWEYSRAGLPVEVVAETEFWRKVRDPLGDESWMHRRLLDGERAVMALEDAPLLNAPDGEDPPLAVADTGAILSLDRCEARWCRVESSGYRGWVRADALWGVTEAERG